MKAKDLFHLDANGKYVVKLRRQLKTEEDVANFVSEVTDLIARDQGKGKTIIFEDFDIAQNHIPLDQLETLFSVLTDTQVTVERFRIFGCPTFDDQACVLMAAWLSEVKPENAVIEMHLSDNAITDDGFQALCEALENCETYPMPDHRRANQMLPLYLRIEHNFIDESAIHEKVNQGILTTFQKRDRLQSSDAKAKVLIHEDGSFQQKEGSPPLPEDAGPPKHVREKGKGKGKGDRDRRDEKGKGKGKGKAERYDRPEASKGKGKGRGKDAPRAALPAPARAREEGPRRTIEKPGQASRAGEKGRSKGSGGHYDRQSNGRDDGGRYARPAQSERPRGPAQSERPRGPAQSERPRYQETGDSRGPERRGGKDSAKGAKGSSRPAPAEKARDARPRPSDNEQRRPKGSGKGKGTTRIPYPWEEHWSDEYQLTYFWNAKTGESTWNPPRA